MHLWSSVTGWINSRTEGERGIGPYQDMDTISMLLTGWVIFILISVVLVKYLYFRFIKKTGFPEYDSVDGSDTAPLLEESGSSNQGEAANGEIGVTTISGVKSSPKPQAPARRRHLRRNPSEDPAAPCNGPDPVVTDFINQIHNWAGNKEGRAGWGQEVKKAFISSLNQVLKDEGSKSDTIISITDLGLKEDLKLYNMFAECSSPNNVKVTSDCELQLRGQVSRSKGGVQVGKEVPFFVDRISGRLSFLLNTEDHSVIVKLDGWPEICVAIPSSSDGETPTGLGDAVASAIRNCLTELNYGTLPGFPTPAQFSPKKEAVKYLLLTVIKGRDLGQLKGCNEAYCAIELDDPPQKFSTDVVRSHDPVWNENFVFNILPSGGGELLFEVHDRVGARFLGCNIISVDEINAALTSGGGRGRLETLKLKSRKMEDSDGYSGTIDVQFTALSESEFLKRSRANNMNICMTSTTRAVFTRPPDSKVTSAAFTDHVIKELGRTAVSNANKSTLVIHAVLRDRAGNGEDPSEAVEIAQYGDERGRRRTRKGDIFTSIRRRFSKGRSHSVMGGDKSPVNGGSSPTPGAEGSDTFLQRSISADRSSMASAGMKMGLGSARSSTSELSGISGFSTTTFVHENSTLVIECVENRVKKYFLVPPNLAESGHYRKKGKKLHIYNDHTFLAKHLSSGTMCEICTNRLPFSIGKQGYQCRDCGMQCHKECHVRAPSFCPKTTIYNIELCTVKPHEVKATPPPVASNTRHVRRSSSRGLFSSLFGGRNGNKATNKVSGETTNPPTGGVDQVNHAFSENEPRVGKEKKKKSNIFRKMTRLGKISEENLASKERLLDETPNDQIPEEQGQDKKEGEQGSETKPEVDPSSDPEPTEPEIKPSSTSTCTGQ